MGNQRDIYFHNLLGVKWHMQTGGNTVLSGQQKQQNVPAGRVVKVVADIMDYHGLCPVAFFLVLARTMRFSPHTGD